MSLQELSGKILSSPVFYGVIALVALLMILSIIRKQNLKKIKEDRAKLEARYLGAKTIPLTFKMNKAKALARVNESVEKIVQECTPVYDETQANLKELQELLQVTDDLLDNNDRKGAKENNRNIDTLLTKTENNVSNINERLDEVLAQETEQRNKINVLKEDFRNIKLNFNVSAARYAFSDEAIEQKILKVEDEFSRFEEYMYASDFRSAGMVKDIISGKINELETIYKELPDLLDKAKETVPTALRDLDLSREKAEKLGVYIDHLQLSQKTDDLNAALKADKELLKEAELAGVDEHLEGYLKTIKELKDQTEGEIESTRVVQKTAQTVFSKVREQRNLLNEMKKNYKEASTKYGFDNMDQQIGQFEDLVAEYEVKRTEINGMIRSATTPSSKVIEECAGLTSLIETSGAGLAETKAKLDKACEDENNARLDLLKLRLIMNELQSKVRKNRLLKVSDSYEEDILNAGRQIAEVERIVREIPVNVTLMNEKIAAAKGFVYTLYNNVNKILGTASTAETAIVIGNRLRANNSDVDAALNHSEILFRNGEYTKALQTAIGAIELIYPHKAMAMIEQSAKERNPVK